MLYEDSMRVDAALIKYYELNGLPHDGGVKDKWAKYKIGPFLFTAFPNFQLRNEAIRRHDVHHIINNLDTSSLGEGLIAAWELGTGCGKFWISWCMESQGLWWGILYAPKRTWNLFLLGRHSRSFFTENFSADVLAKSVGQLRQELLSNDKISAKFSDSLFFSVMACFGLSLMPVFFILVLFFSVIGLFSKG